MFINLFELIEERKQSMFESESINSIKSNAVIIMGPTGSGKTTLVRYLNGEELVNLKVDNKWIIEKKSFEKSDIGHSSKSKTLIPAAYTPYGKTFAYIDNPGFFDNRGMTAEIANIYLMKYALSKVKNFKFLILISVGDINERGLQFHFPIILVTNL